MAVLSVCTCTHVSTAYQKRRHKETDLHAGGLVQAVLLHVDDLAGLAVDAPRVLAVGVFCLSHNQYGTYEVLADDIP